MDTGHQEDDDNGSGGGGDGLGTIFDAVAFSFMKDAGSLRLQVPYE